MRRWNKEEDVYLIAGVLAGQPNKHLARHLGRTCLAIEGRIKHLRERGQLPAAEMGRRPRGSREERAALAAALPAPSFVVPKPRPIVRPPRNERKCLCCGRPFASEGAHNRLCKSCRRRSADPFDTPAVVRYH